MNLIFPFFDNSLLLFKHLVGHFRKGVHFLQHLYIVCTSLQILHDNSSVKGEMNNTWPTVNDIGGGFLGAFLDPSILISTSNAENLWLSTNWNMKEVSICKYFCVLHLWFRRNYFLWSSNDRPQTESNYYNNNYWTAPFYLPPCFQKNSNSYSQQMMCYFASAVPQTENEYL